MIISRSRLLKTQENFPLQALKLFYRLPQDVTVLTLNQFESQVGWWLEIYPFYLVEEFCGPTMQQRCQLVKRKSYLRDCSQGTGRRDGPPANSTIPSSQFSNYNCYYKTRKFAGNITLINVADQNSILPNKSLLSQVSLTDVTQLTQSSNKCHSLPTSASFPHMQVAPPPPPIVPLHTQQPTPPVPAVSMVMQIQNRMFLQTVIYFLQIHWHVTKIYNR